MEAPALQRLLQKLAETLDDEISCGQCFDLVPQYVDLEVAGMVREGSFAPLEQHLRQCAVCHEEYEMLRDFVRREAEGQAENPEGST